MDAPYPTQWKEAEGNSMAEEAADRGDDVRHDEAAHLLPRQVIEQRAEGDK